MAQKRESKVKRYFSELHNEDTVFERLVSEYGLYGVAFFGHGTKNQKRKVSHLKSCVNWHVGASKHQQNNF